MGDYLTFIVNAAEKEMNDKLFAQWCSILPFMHLKMLKYISFQDYKDASTGKNLDMRPTDVIVDELKALHGLE